MRSAASCWRHRSWSGCREGCATRSPAGPAARRCSSGWSWPTCPGPARRGAWLVALPPAVRRPASRPAAAGAARRGPALHHNAAAWQAEHGLAGDAVGHALAAGDAAWAARLVEQQADALLARSEGATLLRWLEALPVDLVQCRPRLLLAQARLPSLAAASRGPIACSMRPNEPGTRQPRRPMSRLNSVGRPASVLANIPATITLQRAILAELHGDAEGTVAHASQALAMLGPGEWTLAALARTHLAVAEWLSGRLPKAESAFAASAAQWRAADSRFRPPGAAITSARSTCPGTPGSGPGSTAALEIAAGPAGLPGQRHRPRGSGRGGLPAG